MNRKPTNLVAGLEDRVRLLLQQRLARRFGVALDCQRRAGLVPMCREADDLLGLSPLKRQRRCTGGELGVNFGSFSLNISLVFGVRGGRLSL